LKRKNPQTLLFEDDRESKINCKCTNCNIDLQK
jgi:hypothetical protein